MTDSDPTRTEGEGETLDLPEGLGGIRPGLVLGERYEIRALLGRGGMGEVWRAFDLKLRVEVALKALREDLFKSERRLEMLRDEVRAAREVVSPNVCRIFDLIEIEDRELVSMEYVDGATLLGVLQERGPLELKEAQDIASQFLSGLEAIHKVGLVHRDIKPENIMLTRAGRVVVMDFGLARQDSEGGGTVAGTPAYMSPEQAAGEALDARADVYSAGVVLAEMVSPDGLTDLESRQSVWDGVRSEPAKLPDTPWAEVITKAVAKDRERRFNTAHTLTRALEDVTLRVEGAEDLHPYPGLASFTEADAEYFFGREAEVEQMWRKLEGPARMLGVVGPSGAGKTSFLQAGAFPAASARWATAICKPGSNPQLGLGRALAPAMAGDTDVMDLLLRFDDPDVAVEVLSRWRHRHEHALLVVDQFEELFTQNSLDVQRRFADLLERLVLEADMHVLLSMRDDFMIRCRDFEALQSTFADLTALPTLSDAALRRALTQPALQCGYRFEDDELVDEMLAEVEGERGALPLLAFAAARLWEKRDRETGLLTRQAYQNIGGVGGALAKHAEATIDQIGHERLPVVRELFRNLVTAEGTRAVREWDELLSVFCDSSDESQAAVLRSLIDARLLTSYEVREDDQEPTRRVEIIHESLLANWPRLVRWQTQDQEGAQLRDELRQAARAWDEHGRQDDRLWSGTAYREFALWRDRYPGGLTELEEAFAAAMASLATRRRHRRRMAVAAVVAFSIVLAAIFGVLWRRSVLETRRAEAAKLLAISQLQIETDPSEALVYAISSLEFADTDEARLFAIKAVWAGPLALALDFQRDTEGAFVAPTFSPDGRWLAVGGIVSDKVLVYGSHGEGPIILGGHAVSAADPIRCGWSRDNLLVTGHNSENRVRVWSMPEGDLVNTVEFGEPTWWQVGDEHLFAEVGSSPHRGENSPVRLVRWRLPDGEAEDLGTVGPQAAGAFMSFFDPRGKTWIYSYGNGLYSRPLPVSDELPDTLLGRHASDEVGFLTWGSAGRFYTRDRSGEIILWKSVDGTWTPSRRKRHPDTATSRLVPDAGGRWGRIGGLSPGPPVQVWDLAGVSGAEPLPLRRNADGYFSTTFSPDGRWLVGAAYPGRSEATFWPLAVPIPTVVKGWTAHSMTPDGRYLLLTDFGYDHPATRVRLLPAPGNDADQVVDLMFPPGSGGIGHSVTVDPTVRRVLATAYGGTSYLFSATDGAVRNLSGFPDSDRIGAGAFSPSGRLVAAATVVGEGRPTLRVWDLETDQVRVLEQPEDPEAWEGYAILNMGFVDETTIYSAGANGLLRWNLESGTSERLARAPPGGALGMRMAADRRTALIYRWKSNFVRVPGAEELFDLETGTFRNVEIPGVSYLALSPDGKTWASSEPDGTVMVGRIDGGDAHVLFRNEQGAGLPFLSPDSRWVVTSSPSDAVFYLWPMPDLSKTPLHTLPHDELIAKLKSLTNLRAVRDEDSSTGWKIEVGPFPGWAEVPEW